MKWKGRLIFNLSRRPATRFRHVSAVARFLRRRAPARCEFE